MVEKKEGITLSGNLLLALVAIVGLIIGFGADQLIMGGKYNQGLADGQKLVIKDMVPKTLADDLNDTIRDLRVMNNDNWTALKAADKDLAEWNSNSSTRKTPDELFKSSDTGGIGIPSEFDQKTAELLAAGTTFTWDRVEGGRVSGDNVFTVWSYDQIDAALAKAIWKSPTEEDVKGTPKDRYDLFMQDVEDAHALRAIDTVNDLVYIAYMSTDDPSVLMWSDPIKIDSLSSGFDVDSTA